MTDITRILSEINAGNADASEQLLPAVYEELRKLAAAKLARERSDHTLQATALVHDAYIRLVDKETAPQWNGRGHFFAAAAEAMRRLLIEHARRRKAVRHGGDWQRVSIDLGEISERSRDEDLIALDEAIARLEKRDATKAELVKLRYFAGLTNSQAAEILGIGVSTADRYWAYSRSWLRAEISRIHSE